MALHQIATQSIYQTTVPHAQRGAVLFISLILLVVLSLIGIAGMQVSTLQERMAGNYYTLGRAFENSERSVRVLETTIKTQVDAGIPYTSSDEACHNLDMDNWAKSRTAVAGSVTYSARIDHCIAGQSSLKYDSKLNEDTTSIYQVTGANSDNTATPANSASLVVVETVFIP